MSLAADLAKEPANTAPKCVVAILLAGFSKEDRDAFEQAIAKVRAVPSDARRSQNYPYTSAWLIGILRSNGYTLGRDSLRKHLLGVCSCESV